MVAPVIAVERFRVEHAEGFTIHLSSRSLTVVRLATVSYALSFNAIWRRCSTAARRAPAARSGR